MKSNLQILKSCGYSPTTMPKNVKEKWMKALRSGEYTQAKYSLYDRETGGFCCLGVLEHVLTGGIEYGNPTNSDGWVPNGLPSIEFYEDWNIDANTEDLTVIYQGESRSLSALNDHGLSFKQIANIIEKQIIGV